jgi:peptidoglycan hydrolase-like protein with peptidoglycan-binding domain
VAATFHRPTRTLVLALAVVLPLVAGACSSDDSSSTTTTAKETTTTTKATGATVRFDKSVQTKLKEVGCYSGNVDGILGPETDAAIVAFQKDSGLSPDGELGPETDTKLTKDAAAGTKVCGSSSSSTTTTPKTTTTTGGSGAPCTATALTTALPSGEQVTGYTCADGWAAVSWTNGQIDGAVILKADAGKWTKPSQDPCGSASAGVPPEILKDGCVS